MATLTGKKIKDTYQGLVKTDNNGNISETNQFLTDGEDNLSALSLGTEKVGIGTAIPSEELDVVGNVKSDSFITNGGTSSQFVKGDGSLDNTTYQSESEKGNPNGYAELDGAGLVPASQLPSYVDDVLEFANLAAFPAIGETGKVYIALDTNLTYRWSGSVYVAIGNDLALGETSSTAYRGDRGKIAYDHTFLTDNPHNVTQTQVGLGNVDNTSDLNKPISTATQSALDDKVDKVLGKQLSTEDYTTSEKNKLAGIEAGAEVNVQSDWNATSGDAFILNKPIIPSGGVTGTGTTNFVSKFTGASSLGNSQIFDNGTNVGIGTTSPSAKLEVTADSLINGITVGRGSGNVSTNTATGSNALLNNTTGGFNTAIGLNALTANTTGSFNTAIGRNSLFNNTTGSENTANGLNALYSNTSGNQMTANGMNALYSNTSGVNNTANGRESLRHNTSGSNNTANGRDSLKNNTTGVNNTANGLNALLSNTSGNWNTANGASALQSNITGINNTANGYQALLSNTTGSNNTANGSAALLNNTTGANNTAAGFNAGRYIANGSTANTTGNNSIFIGTSTKALADNQTNQIVIGDNATGNGSNTATLGNDSIATTVLKGEVIATTLTQAIIDAGNPRVLVTKEWVQNNSSSGAGYAAPTLISTNTTAQNLNIYVLTASLTLTLPSTPTSGDKVKVSNLSGTLTCVVARNGQRIMGLEEDLTIDTLNLGIELIYSGTTKGWIII